MKYTRDQLRSMARTALQARDAGDERWLQLVFNLAIRTNVSPRQCELMIQQLAA